MGLDHPVDYKMDLLMPVMDGLAATPPGQRVRARAEVIAVEGRKVTLHVQAWDESELIGEDPHPLRDRRGALYGAGVGQVIAGYPYIQFSCWTSDDQEVDFW
jgi:hypothetical protein